MGSREPGWYTYGERGPRGMGGVRNPPGWFIGLLIHVILGGLAYALGAYDWVRSIVPPPFSTTLSTFWTTLAQWEKVWLVIVICVSVISALFLVAGHINEISEWQFYCVFIIIPIWNALIIMLWLLVKQSPAGEAKFVPLVPTFVWWEWCFVVIIAL